MAAGVKTAAIVNYEKFVNHPAPPAPAKKPGEAKRKLGEIQIGDTEPTRSNHELIESRAGDPTTAALR